MKPLQTIALAVTIGCAAGSVWFLLEAGRGQSSGLLLALFLGWTLSPFVALAFANIVSLRWSPVSRTALYTVMIVLGTASLAIYGATSYGILRVKVGTIFLVVPLLSWVLSAAIITVAAWIARRDAHRQIGALLSVVAITVAVSSVVA